MSEKFLPEYSRAERVRVLEDNCHSREEMQYHRRLTEDEVSVRKDQQVNLSIKVLKLEMEKKELSKKYSDKIKEEKVLYRLLDEVSTGLEDLKEMVYHVDDQDSGMMITYNADGDVVYKRPLMSSERQLRITHTKKLNENG